MLCWTGAKMNFRLARLVVVAAAAADAAVLVVDVSDEAMGDELVESVDKSDFSCILTSNV